MRNKNCGKDEIKIKDAVDICLDIAKRVVSNENGQILKKEILDKLKDNDIVRISMHISKNSGYKCRLMRDTPYVKIMEKKNGKLLGMVLQEFRLMPEDYYPLRSCDKIWFTNNNIIEILELSEEDNSKYGTGEYVAYTGPLETVDYEEISESGSNSESSASESDLEADDIDIKIKDSRAKLNRGRINN